MSKQNSRQKQESIFFKVLNFAGESCHGGRFKWSLPKKKKDHQGRIRWIPGRWHTLDQSKRLELCRVGFHLTWSPKDWLHGASRVFVCQAGRERVISEDIGHKLCVRKVRLLKEVTFMQERDSYRRILSVERRAHKK